MAKPKHFGSLNNLCDVLGVPRNTSIVDAVQDLDINVTKRDVREATPRNPLNCGYACAIRRQTGAPAAAVMRGQAYILIERDEKPVILRYNTNGDMHTMLTTFDVAGVMAEHEVTLRAPSPKSTLKAKRKYNKEYRAAVAAGERTPEGYGPQKKLPKKVIKAMRPRLSQMAPTE
jgi:ribosomal protein L25 (general stress protein Ctc)